MYLRRASPGGPDRRDTDRYGRAFRDRDWGQAEVERRCGQRGGGGSGRESQEGGGDEGLHRRRHPGTIASAARPSAMLEMSVPILSDLGA